MGSTDRATAGQGPQRAWSGYCAGIVSLVRQRSVNPGVVAPESLAIHMSLCLSAVDTPIRASYRNRLLGARTPRGGGDGVSEYGRTREGGAHGQRFRRG